MSLNDQGENFRVYHGEVWRDWTFRKRKVMVAMRSIGLELECVGGVKRAGLMKLKCVFERARGPHLPTHCRGPRQCHLC